MMVVEYIKLVHVTCAVLTGLSFTGRGLLMIRESSWLHNRFVRVAPHLVDTVLLVSAVALAVTGSWNPLDHSWLLGKIIALLLYISLGMMAFRFFHNRNRKILCWFLALLVLLHIYVFALTRSLGYYEFLI